jgi:gas vesicle protein
MGKKLVGGLFAGLLGAGLYAAYQKLDEDKKNRMKKNLREKSDELRDRAVDYAFYANDAMNDFKDVIKDEMNNAKDNVKDASSKFSEKAKSFDDTDTPQSDQPTKQQDDIVVDATEAFKNSGIPDAADDLNNGVDEQPKSDHPKASDAANPDEDGSQK